MIDTIIKKLSQQADWCDIIEVTGHSTPISFKNNRIHSILEKENSGYGIRVNINKQTGFSYTNEKEQILESANDAMALAKYGDQETFSLPKLMEADFQPYNEAIQSFNIDLEIEKIQAAFDIILTTYPGANIDASINKSEGSTTIYNSKGARATYKNSYYSASISVTYIVGTNNKIDIWEGLTSQQPQDIHKLHEKILTQIDQALTVVPATSGKIPLLLTPKAFARVLSIVASGLNAKSVAKGISPFTGKIGTKMFHESFSLSDNPLLKDSPYSFPFDDEGVKSSPKGLITNGVIANYIADLKYADALQLQPGNGSRGYANLPSPSFSNIEIHNGSENYKDMLKNIKNGILVDQFIGFGQTNTLTGDFSANLDLGFLIENGEIVGRVKDCMIADNLFTLLANDIVLSEETEVHGSASTPYALFPVVNFSC